MDRIGKGYDISTWWHCRKRILLRVICNLIWFASSMHSLKRIKGSVLGCFFSAMLGGSLIVAHMFPESWAFLFYKHLLPTGSCTNVSQKALLLSIIFRRSTQSQIWDSLLLKSRNEKEILGALGEVRKWARFWENKGKENVLCTQQTQ